MDDSDRAILSCHGFSELLELLMKDPSLLPISEDFESEFILFHPQIGICCVEKKSGGHKGTINKAKKQNNEEPLNLKLLFEPINGKACCKIPIVTADSFLHDNLNGNIISKIRKNSPDAETAGKETGSFAKTENFEKFGMNLIDMSTKRFLSANDHRSNIKQWHPNAEVLDEGGGGLETKENYEKFRTDFIDNTKNDDSKKTEHFKKFTASLYCYRGAVYLNGTLNADRVYRLAATQRDHRIKLLQEAYRIYVSGGNKDADKEAYRLKCKSYKLEIKSLIRDKELTAVLNAKKDRKFFSFIRSKQSCRPAIPTINDNGNLLLTDSTTRSVCTNRH
jgi:hypothetical protein